MRYNRVMTHITADTLDTLATLSALELSQEEASSLSSDIERILTYIDQLAELDTDGVEPTYQVTGLQNVWREDTPGSSDLPREQLLELAGENVTNDQIKVPKVL